MLFNSFIQISLTYENCTYLQCRTFLMQVYIVTWLPRSPQSTQPSAHRGAVCVCVPCHLLPPTISVTNTMITVTGEPLQCPRIPAPSPPSLASGNLWPARHFWGHFRKLSGYSPSRMPLGSIQGAACIRSAPFTGTMSLIPQMTPMDNPHPLQRAQFASTFLAPTEKSAVNIHVWHFWACLFWLLWDKCPRGQLLGFRESTG